MFRALPRSSPASGGKLLFCSLCFHLPPLPTWSNFIRTFSMFAHEWSNTRIEIRKKSMRLKKEFKKLHRWPNTPLVFFPLFPKLSTQQKMGAGSPVVSTAQSSTGPWHEDKFCPELTRAIVTGVSESTVNICSTCHWQKAQIRSLGTFQSTFQAGSAQGANESSTLRDLPRHGWHQMGEQGSKIPLLSWKVSRLKWHQAGAAFILC